MRPNSWLSGISKTGNAATNSQAAEKLIINILDNGTMTQGYHKVFGNVIKVRLPNGAGAWWKSSGEFIGFLERFTP
ncbi:hypothetical protein KKF34_14335 [Myxococcota bacterium]|nr:hypothetical protein [Myxococcota bacterium]MBU1380720.1 hypothetical protein [Myxococcota bacterium]MBU1498052.1 hypothetical protein [Myxococcota bacterium]